MTKSLMPQLPTLKHMKKIGKHVKKHHKKYLWSAVGLFGLFKLFAFLIVGLSGYMVTQAYATGRTIITSPAAGSTQTPAGFNVLFEDDGMMGPATLCEYTVSDEGNPTMNRSRPCNSDVWITVGLGGDCTTNGPSTCTVAGTNEDADGNMSNNTNNYRSFSISGVPLADETPPTGGDFTINNDATTTYYTGVYLTTTCGIEPGDGAVRVSYGNTINPITRLGRLPCSDSINIPHTLLSGDGTKTVYMRFRDTANNISAVITDTITLATLTYEHNLPYSININTNTPISGAWLNSNSVPFSWYIDLSNIQTARETTDVVVDGSIALNSSPDIRTLADGPHTRSIDIGTYDGVYGVTETFYVDTIVPTGTITINGGQTATNNAVTTLTLAGIDANGISGMQFSCNNSTWSIPEAYATSKSFNITNQAGAGCTTTQSAKTVYVKYLDKSGKRSSSTIVDSIIYDSLPPTAPTLICTNFTGNISSNYTGTTTCGINNTAAPSASTSIAYSINNGLSRIDNGNSQFLIPFIPAEGTTSLIFRVSDSGGGPTNSNTYVIIKDTSAPTITITNPNTDPAQSKTVTASVSTGTLTMTAGSAISTCNATRTFITYASTTFSSEADNGKYVCYRVVDVLGNTGYLSSAMIAGIDLTAPSAPTCDASQSFSSTIAPTCTTATGTIKYTVNASAPTCASPTRYGLGFTSTTVLRVISCDTADNASSVNTYTYTLDNTAPTIPTMAAEPAYTTGTSNTVSIGGFGQAGLEYQFCRNTSNSTTFGCVVSSRSSVGNTTFTALTNGVRYYYFAKARDTLLNESNWSASTSSTQDATPPITSIFSPATGSTQTGNFAVRFTDSDTLSLGLCAYRIVDNGTQTLGWTARTCDTNVTINQAAYCSHPGVNTCIVYGVASDEAGNTGNIASRSFTIDTTPADTTPPVLTQITPVPSPTNDTTPNYTFNSTEAGTVTYGGSCSPLVDVNVITGNNTVTFATLTNGTYGDCTIVVKDDAGNVSNTLAVTTFTIDTIKPTCTIAYSPSSATNQNVSATCTASETVTYQQPAGTNVYTFTANTSYVFNFTDTAGNTGTTTATVNWIDKTAPVLAQITAVPSPTNDTTPEYTFSSTEAGSITYGGSCASATTTAISGNTTITFNTLSAGNYSNCTIVVTDSVGNQSNILAVNTFTVNTNAPTITVNNPGTTPAQSKTITASTSTGTLTMTIGSTSPTCDATRTFIPYASTTFTTEADNGKYICYRAIDSAGNTGYQSSTIIGGIDTTKPTCSLAYSPSSATNQNVSATCTANETVTYAVGTNVNIFTTNGSYTFNFTDLAGNTGTTTATVTRIDKTAPVLAQVTAVPNPTADTTPDYTFSSTEAGSITYGGNCASATTTAISGNTTISFNTLSAGTYNNCTIVVTDSVGNQSNILAVNTFTVNTNAPIITVNNPGTTPAQFKTITASASTGTLTMTEGSPSTICDASRTFVSYASTTFTTEADNGKYVCYKALDSAGNSGYALSTIIGGIDTTKPICSLAYSPSSTTNQNVTATCTASETVVFQYPAGSNVYTFIYNGSYLFSFTDIAGNTGTTTATVTRIDKTAPVLSQVTAVPSLTADTTPDYTLNSSEAGTITYGGSCTSATTTAAAGNTTITFNAVSTGIHNNCTITLTDSVGNASNILTVNTFTVDTTLPTAPYIFTSIGTGICPSIPFILARSGSTNTSPISGGSQFSGYRYEVYSTSGMVTGMVLSGNTSTTGVSLTVSSLPLGIYYMRVRAINTLGTMTASNTVTFTLATQSCATARGTGVIIATPRIWLRNVDLDSVYRSDPIIILGLTGSTPISISRGTLFINNSTGAGGTTGMVTSNDTIYIEMISSTGYDTTINSYLRVLGLTGTFSLTTKKSNCTLSAAEKIVIQNIYADLKDQYNNDLSKLADFLTIFQSMVEDESALGNSCNLEYLLGLIEEDLGFEGGIDTSDHITPNCKEYTIGYDNDQGAYYAPEMMNRYYFVNRESIVRHLDYYNPGDCHVNTYGNNFRVPDTSDPMRHIAPNGKIYNLIGQYGGFSASEFTSAKYFDSLDSIVRYIDIRNPAKSIWNHTVDTSFTPITYIAPNSKTYKIYKTDRGYMSYKLMNVRYYTTLAQLQSYITSNNPSR